MKCIVPVMLGILVIGCTQKGVLPPAETKAVATPVVKTASAQQRKLQRYIVQPGSVRAEEETTLMARVPGYVERVNVNIGDEVKAGQVLVELDVPELVQEGKQKSALVAQAKAEVEQSRKMLAAAEADVIAEEAHQREAEARLQQTLALVERWQSELRRIGGLVDSGVLSNGTRDETLNQFRAAESNRDEAKARLAVVASGIRKAMAQRDLAASGIDVALAKQAVAEADAARLAAMIGYAQIKAPFAGIVTRRNVDTGHLVQPATMSAMPMLTVMRSDRMRVVVELPEAEASRIDAGAMVEITIPSLGGRVLKKPLTRSAFGLEPGGRTLRIEVDVLANEAPLRPGMYINARVLPSSSPVWTVPAAAVVRLGETTIIYRVVNGVAVKTPVILGASDAAGVEIARMEKQGQWASPDGTEMIVVDGAALLNDGMQVTIAK